MDFPGFDKLKIFTIEEAQKTLPYVKKIVEDLQLSAKRFRYFSKILQDLTRNRPIQEEITKEEAKLKIEELEQEMREILAELEEVGCLSKGALNGLVDWLAIRKNGEQVWLCWQLGEKEIEFWHTLEGGFRARQPISSF